MKSFVVSPESSGKQLVRVALAAFPTLTATDLYRALRARDVKVNGKRVSSDGAVFSGDSVELWIPDSCFDASSARSERDMPDYRVVFESDHLLLVNKRPGLSVHPGKGQNNSSLIELIRKNTQNDHMDLCHRIDRNTGGLVLLSKSKEALSHALRLFADGLITKRYRCLVRGVPRAGSPLLCADDTVMNELNAFLEKSPRGAIFVHDTPHENDVPIISRYRVLRIFEGKGPDGESFSELEVELVTGRTHQIRAHFAHIGHPILGDGKYGRNEYNRFFRTPDSAYLRRQQLSASSLIFSKIPLENIHSYLSKRTFSIDPIYDITLE